MNNFPEFENENMGGIQYRFIFTPDTNIQTLTIASQTVADMLDYLDSYDVFTGNTLIDSCLFSEKEIKSEAGSYYETKFSGFIPKLNKEYLILFAEMVKRRFILLITDNNNYKRILGKPSKGLIFSFEQNSQQTPAGLNGFKFEFATINPEPSPFYTYVE